MTDCAMSLPTFDPIMLIKIVETFLDILEIDILASEIDLLVLEIDHCKHLLNLS